MELAQDNAALEFGAARGDPPPATPIAPAPVFVWPPRPVALAKFLFGCPGYFLPLNILYMALAAATWLWLTPDLARMADLRWDWVGIVYGRNLALTFLVYGGLHLRFYILKSQGTRFMLNRREPTTRHKRYWFGSQVRENVFWTAGSGVLVWSAYEVATLWAYANGWIPMLDWEAHPVLFVLLYCAIPMIRDAHFYFVHRLLHHPALYGRFHALHHKNTDIGPWSGMSMHPVEHVLYFSGVLIHWVLPSHPVHAIFHVMQTGLAPALGHVGFHKLLTKNENVYGIGQRYFHFLHHRYFECNYGGDGTVPLDKWFGSWHDGTPASHETMRARRAKAHGA
jgi:sterol desaturase/sphingolipid hydroxylase (fatty acid hydroxylase superfamily)